MATIKVHVRERTVTRDTAISFNDLSPADLTTVEESMSSPDPYAVLRAKITAVADLLDCTEEEAERVIFKRAGCYA